MSCNNDYHMVDGINDKYFKGKVEFFNLNGYDFVADGLTTIENVKSKYRSLREENYKKIQKLLNDINDVNDKEEEVEFNTKDNYDEQYKGNGITDGSYTIIADNVIVLFSYNSNDNIFIYSYTSVEEGGKKIITLGEIDEEHTYLTIKDTDELTCNIDIGKYSYKNIKEKCPDEYETILEKKKSGIQIPKYIENNKIYYSDQYKEEAYEISNADIHYKIDHPRINNYPAKFYEIWSWRKLNLFNGYVLQTNTSVFQIVKLNKNLYKTYGYVLYNYSFNPDDGSVNLDRRKPRFFHLVENDSRICYEGEPFDTNYLVDECYKVKSIIFIFLFSIEANEVIEQFNADFPAVAEKTKNEVEECLDSVLNGEVNSIQENQRINEMKLRQEEEKGYYYEYYFNDYDSHDSTETRHNHYRGYFITSNQFIIIYQYTGDKGGEKIYQIKLIYDITNKMNFNIYDFNCESSEIELQCSDDTDCPDSKKLFKDEFNNCNNKEEIDVYLNDLVGTNININIENRRINITKAGRIFLLIPLEDRQLSTLENEISIITKNTRGIPLDKSYDSYLINDKNKLMYNILKINEGMIVTGNRSDDSIKAVVITFENATEMITNNYFSSYHDYDFHAFTLPNEDFCMTYVKSYHRWINQGRYPFINDFSQVKQMLISNLNNQFNNVYEAVINSMKNEQTQEATESPNVTTQPTDINDKGNIIEISITLLICVMIMIIAFI